MERCSGGLKVSEKALLAMLGGSRFARRAVVSDSEAASADLRADVAASGLDSVASGMGITKSSLKRRLRAPEAYQPAYDEAGPTGAARRYLEASMGSWRVAGFDVRRNEACLETRTGVRLSVDVPRQATRIGRFSDRPPESPPLQ